MISGQRLTKVLADRNLLFAALLVAIFFQFALNRSGVESAVWTAGVVLGAQVATGRYRPWDLPRRDLFVLMLFGLVLLLSWVSAPQETDVNRSLRIVRFLIIVLAVRQLATQSLDRRHAWWAAAVACAAVLWQAGVRLAVGRPYGAFANPHYIAYFMTLLLPVLLLLARWIDRPYRYLVFLAIPLDLWLVFNDLQKPTIPLLAISAALGSYAWSAARPRTRWSLVSVAVVLVGAMFYLPSDWLGGLRLAAPAEDERVRLWTDAWRMIAAGDLRAWVLGHGIGTFRGDLAGHTIPEFTGLTMPHNHVLEMLYENGVVVATVVTVFVGHLWLRAVRLTRRLDDATLNRIARANLAGLAIWLVFSFLAFDTYSRYTLYPFGFLLGVHLYLSDAFGRQAEGTRGVESIAETRPIAEAEWRTGRGNRRE